MAAETANQKVFVPLISVLKLQSIVQTIEQLIEQKQAQLNDPQSAQTGDSYVVLKTKHAGFRLAIETLGLPIQIRAYPR